MTAVVPGGVVRGKAHGPLVAGGAGLGVAVAGVVRLLLDRSA